MNSVVLPTEEISILYTLCVNGSAGSPGVLSHEVCDRLAILFAYLVDVLPHEVGALLACNDLRFGALRFLLRLLGLFGGHTDFR